ncbi:hypothetical protein N7447_004204 [Penicillium robsamsonii]|uniref:uncharacterized protein n=1 Tax=Penicillium robsamsonii TaxID=1792511 RepID=UPI0025475EF8|nr:uncharacterized protein N7447_004204 [Penicillium robsamsonii]KAJ5827441.1 hypothetical protein N7447_004204 [Penicillium robsamsonii]
MDCTLPLRAGSLTCKASFFFNADHYPTEKYKMVYIASRTTGIAHVYLNLRLRQDAMYPYTTAQHMFDDLEWKFGDLNDAAEACNGLDRPNMKPTDDFHTFLCMFLYKSGANRTRFGCLKRELYDRLTQDLKRAVMPATLDNGIKFDEFTKLCGQEERLLGHGHTQNKKGVWKKGKKVTSRAHELSGSIEGIASALATGDSKW